MAIILSGRFRQRQATAGATVLGLHLLVIMAWWSQEHPMPVLRSGPIVTPISVWLAELPQAVVPPPKSVPARSVPTPQSSEPLRDHTHDAAVSDLAPATAPGALPAQEPGSAGVPAPAMPAPALNLSLSSKDIASLAPPSFAAQSPFHGKLPPTVELAIANVAAQTGPWVEERVDLDHVRFRRGNTCIMMERPRATSLDPFSDAYARMPWKARTTDC